MRDFLLKNLYRLECKLFGHRFKQPVLNVNGVSDPTSRKRALLVYLTLPFHLKIGHPAFRFHQSLYQARQIAGILGEFGYAVDVVDVGDRDFRPEITYDLVLNHRVDFEGLEAALGKNTIKIYFASGMNHASRNANLRKRLDYLKERRGISLSSVHWETEEMPFVEIADALIGFGNHVIMETWRPVISRNRYPFDNYGVCAQPKFKDWNIAKRHFLFFGSVDQIRKGLDLLLDSFPHMTNIHLHVCSAYKREPDFCNYFRHELQETPNIHTYGYVDIGGKQFRKLIDLCGFTIMPTCAEGSPGSVINAMSAGLIAIVTREAGVDLDDFGFLLEDDRIETISRVVQEVSELPDNRLTELSQLTRHAAETRFSEEAFIERWREILRDIHSEFQESAS